MDKPLRAMMVAGIRHFVDPELYHNEKFMRPMRENFLNAAPKKDEKR